LNLFIYIGIEIIEHLNRDINEAVDVRHFMSRKPYILLQLDCSTSDCYKLTANGFLNIFKLLKIPTIN